MLSCDDDDCILDCAGSCNENVELWGECYNIETTTELFLLENQLTGEIPAEIGNLTNLTYLILQNNNLTGDIPIEVCNLIENNNLDINSILNENSLNNTCP